MERRVYVIVAFSRAKPWGQIVAAAERPAELRSLGHAEEYRIINIKSKEAIK